MLDSQPSKRALRPSQVAAKFGVSVPTVWRYARTDPTFPRGAKLSERCTVFDDVRAGFLVERQAGEGGRVMAAPTLRTQLRELLDSSAGDWAALVVLLVGMTALLSWLAGALE